MADIRDQILKKYGIDIKVTNPVKLYNLKDPNISGAALEAAIQKRRSSWEQSINGANEKFAERDRKHLENADQYEAILRDPQLRKELFEYAGKKGGKESADASPLVKKYFQLISSTTKISRENLTFFLKYFPEESKNKKPIERYLKATYKVILTPSADRKEKDDDLEEEEAPEKPRKDSGMITNLFSEETVLKLRECELCYQKARQIPQVMAKYPSLQDSLYEYLGIGQFTRAEDFKKVVADRRTEIYDVRSEFGSDFSYLQDLYNKLAKILENGDVRDNFEEFKLLVMYPALTPYMYEIRELKKDSLDQLCELATTEYGFRNRTDFLLSYFNQTYDNFGICADSIRKIMKDAAKQAGKEKVVGKLSSWLGMSRRKNVPAAMRAVFYLAYWPVYVLSILFNIVRFAVEKLRYIGVGAGILISLVQILGGEAFYGSENLFTHGLPLKPYLCNLMCVSDLNWLGLVVAFLAALIMAFFMYAAAGLLVGRFAWVLSVSLRKRVDLIGITRTIQAIIENAKTRSIEQFQEDPNTIWAKKTPLIIMNFVGLCLMIAVITILCIVL